MNSLLEKILLEFERLIQGNEQNAIVLLLFIITIGIGYLYLVKSYVDPYEKAKKELNWEPKTSLDDLVQMMVDNDIHEAKQESVLLKEGLIEPTWENPVSK